MRAAIYVRVSTASRTRQGDAATFDQNPAVQEHSLRELLAQRGWELAKVYQDRASGAKERRPGLDALIADARRGAFDAVVVWRFDRFARSVKQLVLALEEFRGLGIEFISHQEGIFGRATAAAADQRRKWIACDHACLDKEDHPPQSVGERSTGLRIFTPVHLVPDDTMPANSAGPPRLQRSSLGGGASRSNVLTIQERGYSSISRFRFIN